MKQKNIFLISMFGIITQMLCATTQKISFDTLPKESTEQWIYNISTSENFPDFLLEEVNPDFDRDRVVKEIGTGGDTVYYAIPKLYDQSSPVTGHIYDDYNQHWFDNGVTITHIARHYQKAMPEHTPIITYTIETWTSRHATINKKTAMLVAILGLTGFSIIHYHNELSNLFFNAQ